MAKGKGGKVLPSKGKGKARPVGKVPGKMPAGIPTKRGMGKS
jgi:hypothetical protein